MYFDKQDLICTFIVSNLMRTLLIMTLLFTGHAFSETKNPEWFCTEEAGKREGRTLWSCGVGEEPLEQDARRAALHAAMGEFRIICEASADCKPTRVSVEPKRMSCIKQSTGWKCYRLIQVTMEDKT